MPLATPKLVHGAQEISATVLSSIHDQDNPVDLATQDACVNEGKSGRAVQNHGIEPFPYVTDELPGPVRTQKVDGIRGYLPTGQYSEVWDVGRVKRRGEFMKKLGIFQQYVREPSQVGHGE